MSFPVNSPWSSGKKKNWGKGKSENARFSLLMKNTPSISLKMSLLFASLLPFAWGFLYFNCRRFRPKATCGFCLLWSIWRLSPARAGAGSCSRDTNSIPPCYRSSARACQLTGALCHRGLLHGRGQIWLIDWSIYVAKTLLLLRFHLLLMVLLLACIWIMFSPLLSPFSNHEIYNFTEKGWVHFSLKWDQLSSPEDPFGQFC